MRRVGGLSLRKKCFIAEYIRVGGREGYDLFKEKLIEEFNLLDIPGMPKINELYAINGAFVNPAYPMPDGRLVKLLDDNAIYLATQVECEFNDGSLMRCFGLVGGPDFLLVGEYGENCADPELIIYKKR